MCQPERGFPDLDRGGDFQALDEPAGVEQDVDLIGGVQVRTYATVAISTDATDDTLTTFGKPIFLTRPEQNR